MSTSKDGTEHGGDLNSPALTERLRRLVLERTHSLLELDAILRGRGETGVLQRPEADLPVLEAEVLGPPLAPAPPGPDALTDDERRSWVRRHVRLITGGLE